MIPGQIALPEKRHCLVCGAEFKPAHGAHVYCGVECWKKENTEGDGFFAEQVKGVSDGS